MREELLLFRRCTLRHWRRAPGTTALLVLILALGVGVFLSIRLANRAAVSGFGMFTESLTGESDFIVRPTGGGQLPREAPAELRAMLNPMPVTILPVIEAAVFHGEQSLRLIGLDLVSLRDGKHDFGEEKAQLESAFVSEGLGAEGSVLQLQINDRVVTIEIANVLKNEPLRPEVPPNLVLLDLPRAHALLGMKGFSRIELRVPPGVDAGIYRRELAVRLSTPGRWVVETPTDRRESAAKMTRAFRLNLTVLSTLALLVGTYLILQALEAAVVRRRPEIATLRSLGVTPGTIRRAWLLESVALGTVGSLAGIAAGYGGAQLAVGNIARTVNALYFQTTTTAAALNASDAVLALSFGLLASSIAGWVPARDAAATPPAQSLRTGALAEGMRVLAWTRGGWMVLAVAVALAWLPPWEPNGGQHIPLGGYLSALAALTGFSMMMNPLFPVIGRILPQNRPAMTVAASHLRRPTGRHRLAAAGLLVAIGMAAGMGILVHSFEATLMGWIHQLLKADLYVAPAGGGVIRAETWRQIVADDAVEGFDMIRQYEMEFAGRRIFVAGSEYKSDRSMRMIWLEAPANARPGAGAWINEAFSRRFRVGRGDDLKLDTPAGTQRVRVKGVYADYSDEFGTVLLNRDLTQRWFNDDSISNLALYLKPGAGIDAMRERLVAKYPALAVRTNGRLREDALRVFRQTFAVTYALEGIAVVVAVAGLGLSLASLLLERRADMRTLKSLGFSRSQLAEASAIEGAALAAVGAAGGFALSLALGALLVFVINRQSFGWTLDFQVPLTSFAGLSLLTLSASAAVAAGVGFWGAKLRSEQEE